MGIEDVDNLTKHIEEQIETAIDRRRWFCSSSMCAKGLMPLGPGSGRRLRYVDMPVVLVANKADDAKLDAQAAEFYKLGRGKPIAGQHAAEPQPRRSCSKPSSSGCRHGGR